MSKKQQNTPQPMDPNTREVLTPVAKTNQQRDCYAIKQLVAEFTDLFPETPYETSNHDGHNVALDVTFDLTVLDTGDRSTAAALLELTETDSRVIFVVVEDDLVLVTMQGSARTKDLRDSFGLADAYDILIQDDAEYGDVTPFAEMQVVRGSVQYPTSDDEGSF